jgi:hypothetical protein
MDDAAFAPPIPDREESLAAIIRHQHEKPVILIVRELLHQIRAVLRTEEGTTLFRVSVSSLDPTFANIDLYSRQREVVDLLQADLPEIRVHTEYEYSMFGGVSGGFCCSTRRPRHRLIVNVVLVGS